MHNEQVFTPKSITYTMLQELYGGQEIRKKHIIDNSCGNGAILKKVVRIYIGVCIKCNVSKEETIEELETYIHGIEIDEKLYQETIENLNKVAEEYQLYSVKWDILNADTMDVHTYDNMMDYVIGNPPYCNIHDIPEEKREKVKSYKFANGGMTDMYLVFFEIGINMLNENGKLAYITPNSWLTSTAGTNFRNYLKESKTLYALYQFGHYKVFDNVNTYTCITCLFKQKQKIDGFKCYRNISETECHFDWSFETLDNCMIDGKIYLTDKNTLKILKEINNVDKKKKNRIRVKNGFATLNDKFFIVDEYVEKYGLTDNIIEVTKASNGDKHYFFYPYDKEGNSMNLLVIDDNLVAYMRDKSFDSDVDTENVTWYLYGRSQAIRDVKYNKIAINNLIRNVDDINMNFLINADGKQEGVYSGYYIPVYENYNGDFMSILRTIKTQDFVDYVKAIGKYKNGGYYTFSTKELENWLNYYLFEKD